ncbi:DinB family protein [Gracilibacillus sp. YIM 98692]|uniref:DinB family protein n=1 Tax=Gracilibacillus sp. YIM 98692 TaxID=2663532 RepID=UPI0013D3FE72|nr:DinB family protein [Gracilibacillus sp. YIM 98692]
MADSKVEMYIKSITSSLEKIVETIETISEEEIRWNPSTEEWSILQILSHINESTFFWLSELDAILERPGFEWGRGLQHDERLAAVNSPDELKVAEVIPKIKGLKQEIINRLSQVSDERLLEENPHRNYKKFGDKPISFLIEHFLVDHMEGHYHQIQRNLSKFKDTTSK